jgi:hypothetical protein
MSDPEVRKERRLRLPFVEIRVQTLDAPAEERLADADSLVTNRSGFIRPGLSADWFATLPMVGILLLGFAVAEEDWGLAAAGAVATTVGIWLMSRRLGHRDPMRKAAWIAIDLGMNLAAVGLAVALSGSWWFWLVLIGGVLLAPTVASGLIPEES